MSRRGAGSFLTLDDLAKSRTLGSKTPGHPEVHHTVGVEMSTGPLGQGVASAVGMAMAARHESAVFTPGSSLLDHTTWVLAGDGCLQEGVSGEASSLAGTLGLDNLVLIWDDNAITIDSGTDETFSEDVRARYRAYGWRVLEIDTPTDLDALEATLREAAERTARPTLLALRTVIGAPSAKFGGTSAAHSGGFGADELALVKATLGFAPDAPLHDHVSRETLEHTREALTRGDRMHTAWEADLAAWGTREPEAATRWQAFRGGEVSTAALDTVKLGEPGDLIATRKTNGAVLRAFQTLLSGAARPISPAPPPWRSTATGSPPPTRPASSSASEFASTPWPRSSTASRCRAHGARSPRPTWCSVTTCARASASVP